MLNTVAPLAQPLTLQNGVVLKNRIVKSAMSECLGDFGLSPTQGHVRLYQRWANSGASVLITGNIMVDRTAIGEVGNVVVDDERDLALLSEWATAAKSSGSQVWAQINHPGRQIPANLNMRPVAPSAVRLTGSAGLYLTPRELTDSEIVGLVAKFAETARVLVSAGFDGIEIHAAHGYLISQFLSPATNRRTDRWGGDARNRRRFLLEVVRAARAAIGPSATLAVKLNSADFQSGGFDEDEAAEVARALDAESIDVLEISGGTYETVAFMGVAEAKSSTRKREAYFLDFAERIRSEVSTPLLLTGGFRTAEGMSAAIESNAVDLAGVARPLALVPDFPNRLLDGDAPRSIARQRNTGIKQIDGLGNIVWHTTQLWRLGEGKDPAPDRSPYITMAHYLSRTVPYILRRLIP
ncbi:NADH:flavin oxidoreductase/NADH oxidase family protein [Lolliginicoccus levis]|uniref:NADH:flavin oxidoreductase/NADH oxidase family protein n=1 Tax=Lolliginicoccus levis TaxID=2919542 RepID=UPI00241E0473|nr:NADH:flavin oxidoreductase/NADH oxidase family protein [Lolliginicoccus levis]